MIFSKFLKFAENIQNNLLRNSEQRVFLAQKYQLALLNYIYEIKCTKNYDLDECLTLERALKDVHDR